MAVFTKKSVFAGAAVLLCSTASYVAGQGCSNRCPPNNYGVIVPALCEGDYIDDASSGEAVDLEHVYAVCSPAAPTTSTIENATPLQFTWNDLRGPSNTVTVIANYYTGCNAGRRESGVFAHVAQKYYDQYGPDKVHFIQSVKGGGTCDQWSSIYQRDAQELYPFSDVIPQEMPWSVDDTSYKIRDEFFTSPFGHPAYVVLDGNLQLQHKFIGPCCGYERYAECTPEIARTLETTLSTYLDTILMSVAAEDEEEDNSTTRPDSNTSIPPQEEDEDGEDSSADDEEEQEVAVVNLDCTWSEWSPCSVRCGPTPGTQIRYTDHRCAAQADLGFTFPLFESRDCTSGSSNCFVEDGGDPCIPEVGEQYAIQTIHDGFQSPRDVKFHPTPGHHLGSTTEGRTFVHPADGDEAWIINGNNHTISIVAAVGHPDYQTSFARRDRGYYHYMINGTAISFNSVQNSGRTEDRDTYNYWSICNANNNNYLDTKEQNYFMGPTLYDSSSANKNLVNKLGEICDPEKAEECYFLHSDMLHESPSCRGIVHDPELVTSYGTVYWVFDATGNNQNGQLVRYDFQQPHGPGSMDHSIASVRRYVEIELETTDEATNHAGIHAGMVIHPTNRHLYIAVPGKNQILKVDIDSGRFARTAREEYPIFSNRLPSFEYSIWECVDRSIFLENVNTPSGLAFSANYERLFVAERGTGNILVVDVDTGAILTTIETQFTTIGGMEISPNGGELYFVDDITGTLNAVTVQSKCGSQLYAVRTDPGYTSAVNEAKLALNVDNPFLLEESQQECRVDPIVPNVTFFDQVHLDTGYASDNPDVQSNHTGMDEAAALLANRTDCEYDSELNFDALLLGGYFCHVCLPEQDLTCTGGGSCTNIQWTGYICDNEFQIVDNPNPALPGTYRIQTLNGTDVDPSTLVLKTDVTYSFLINVEEEVCLSVLQEIRDRNSDKIGSASSGGYATDSRTRNSDRTSIGRDSSREANTNNGSGMMESVEIGCSTRADGPLLFKPNRDIMMTGMNTSQLYVTIGFGTESIVVPTQKRDAALNSTTATVTDTTAPETAQEVQPDPSSSPSVPTPEEELEVQAEEAGLIQPWLTTPSSASASASASSSAVATTTRPAAFVLVAIVSLLLQLVQLRAAF